MPAQGFFWLVNGHLAGSALPGSDIRTVGRFHPGMTLGAALDDDLHWLRAQGIRAILTLTEEPLPEAALARHAMAALHLPIEDQTAPTQSQLLAALDFIDQRMVEGKPTLVHCRVGEGRTGCILAAYLIREGASPDEALARLRAIRPGAVSAPAQQRALRLFAHDRAWII